MLAKPLRFHGHNALRAVYQNGSSAYGANMKLLWRKGNGFKAAVVVSKKVHKSAIVRNRIRRRIYEQVRLYASQQQLSGVHIVFVVQNEVVASEPAALLQTEVLQLLQKIKH